MLNSYWDSYWVVNSSYKMKGNIKSEILSLNHLIRWTLITVFHVFQTYVERDWNKLFCVLVKNCIKVIELWLQSVFSLFVIFITTIIELFGRDNISDFSLLGTKSKEANKETANGIMLFSKVSLPFPTKTEQDLDVEIFN